MNPTDIKLIVTNKIVNDISTFPMNFNILKGCSYFYVGSLIESSDGNKNIEIGIEIANITEQKMKGDMYPPNMYNRVPQKGPNISPTPLHTSI